MRRDVQQHRGEQQRDADIQEWGEQRGEQRSCEQCDGDEQQDVQQRNGEQQHDSGIKE